MDRRSIQRLLELLTNRVGRGPINFDSEEGQELLALLKQFDTFAQNGPDLGQYYKDFGKDFDELKQIYENRLELNRRRDMILGEEKGASQTIVYMRRRQINKLRSRMKFLLKNADSNEEELSNLQEEIKVLTNLNKIENRIQKGEKKGAEMADRLLASATGIKASFLGGSGPKGMMKGLKGMATGFVKGAAARLSPLQILIQVIVDSIEQAKLVEKAGANFFKRSGFGGFADDISMLNRQMVQFYGGEAAGVAGSALSTVIGIRSDLTKVKDARNRLASDVMRYGFMGVSAEAIVDSSKFFGATLDYTSEQQQAINRKLFDISQKLGRPPEEIFREVAESLPVLGRFGRNFPQIFTSISVAARRAGLKVSDLIDLIEDQDHSENVLRSVGKFNALLGGNFLNPLELLSANAGEKLKVIRDAFHRARAAGASMPPRLMRTLYKQFGLDASKFGKIVGASYEGMEDEVGELLASPVSSFMEINSDMRQGLDVSTNLLNQFSRLGAMGAELLYKVVPHVIDFVLKLFGYDFITSDEIVEQKESAEKVRADLQKELDKRAENDKTRADKMLKKGEINKKQHKLLYDYAGIGVKQSEFQKAAMGSPKKKDKSGKTVESDLFDRTESFDSRSLDRILFQSEDTVNKGIHGFSATRESAPVPMKNEDAAVGTSYAPLTLFQPHMPGILNTAKVASFNQKYPHVNAKFETSNDDGVLLTRLQKLKEGLEKLAEKKTNINFNVDRVSIGGAVM